MAMSTSVICTHPIPFSLIPSAKPLVFSLLYYSYKTLAAGLCTNSPPRIIFSLTADTRLGDKSVFNNKLIWHRVFPSPHNSTSLYLYLDILSLLFLTKKEPRTKSLLPSSIHKIKIHTFGFLGTAKQIVTLMFDIWSGSFSRPLSSILRVHVSWQPVAGGEVGCL